MRHGLRIMGLRIWPERSSSRVAHSAQMWEGDEGIRMIVESGKLKKARPNPNVTPGGPVQGHEQIVFRRPQIHP